MMRRFFPITFACVAFLLICSPAQAATITVNVTDGPGEGFNDTTPATPVGGNAGTTVGEQRLIAFEYAAQIWGNLLDSDVAIVINAHFDPLYCTTSSAVLGAAGPNTVHRNFGGGSLSNTWYVGAQANSMAGTDLSGSDPEIDAQFQSELGQPDCMPGLSWYYGLDDNEGSGEVSLLITLLHEFGHGLGFLSLVDLASGALFYSSNDIFSNHILDNTEEKHWDEMSSGERLLSMVNTGELVWDGEHVNSRVSDVMDPSPVLVVSQPVSIAGNYAVVPAGFGPSLTVGGITAAAVMVEDATAPTGDACEGLLNAGEISGKIALIDRGNCDFTTKVKAAQVAGAVAVIVVNNVGGDPIAMSGTDATITIPSVMISMSDGQTLKNQLESGVEATLKLDATQLAGVDASGRLLLYAPDPVEQGSSVSHWDVSATPNLLMEPYLNADLGVGVDFTLDLFQDLGWQITQVPVAIVSGLWVERRTEGAVLSWEMIGFDEAVPLNIHREDAGSHMLCLNPAPIEAEGMVSYLDEFPSTGESRYWVEVLDQGVDSQWFGPAVLAATDLSTQLSLAPALPNPFRQETTISFSLPSTGRVSLSIHDLRGREVRHFPAAVRPMGSYQMIWDGRNQAGQTVSAGVYFARLHFESGIRSQKIVRLH